MAERNSKEAPLGPKLQGFTVDILTKQQHLKKPAIPVTLTGIEGP